MDRLTKRWLRWVGVLPCVAAVGAAPLAAQVVRGVIADSVTRQPIQGATVIVTGVTDSLLFCSVPTRADGRFRCTPPAGVRLTLVARRIGYTMAARPLGALTAKDSLEVDVTLGAAIVTLDTVRVADTSELRRLFSVTPGRVQFQRHMELGKGHFLSGFEIQRSGERLSVYLSHFDSLKLTHAVISRQPVIPAANGTFLTSTVKSQCLYGRIDRWNIGGLLRDHGAQDIDDLLRLDEIVGVELYLDYHDVPPDWRMDAFPTSLYRVVSRSHPTYWMGSVGLPAMGGVLNLESALGAPSGASRNSGLTPTCPLLQIWTRVAW